MKTCGDLETAVAGTSVSYGAVIASPDRWLAGIYAAAVRFVVWDRDRVQGGWLGGSLTIVHGTSRRTLSLARLALEPGIGPVTGWTPLHPLLSLGPSARVAVSALRCGDVVQLDARAGQVTRLVLARGSSDATLCSA